MAVGAPLPTADECVVRNLIDRRARTQGDKVFACFEDGTSWTYAELKRQVTACAAALTANGVEQGDIVVIWLPNGAAALRTILAINYLGAACAPLGIGSRGAVLEHVLRNCAAKLMVADARLVERLNEVDRCGLQRVLLVNDAAGQDVPGDVEFVMEWLDLDAGDAVPSPERPIAPWDTQFVLYTSGTTGPSKGVLTSYLHRYAHSFATRHLQPDDRRLIHAPLSHTGGVGSVYGMLARGGSIAIVESFKTDRFWADVRRFGATTTSLLGVTLPYLLQQPPSDLDRGHTLRTVQIAPVDVSAPAFAERFGVSVFGVYNMTEISVPLWSDPNPSVRGICGRPRPGVEVRIVDENDIEVEPGKIGELIVRTSAPWSMMHGYLNNPEATAEAWRNGWFHTGDAFRQDEDGVYFFADRLKDAVRRRGENISSFEVESEIARHPRVREVAVVAAKSDISEDEVLAVVSITDASALPPAELIEFLRPRLPYFMIPRYIRFMPALPRTTTQKIVKHQLRVEGVTPDTWDRDQAGIVVRRDRL